MYVSAPERPVLPVAAVRWARNTAMGRRDDSFNSLIAYNIEVRTNLIKQLKEWI
jgi:hypothetical protein